MKMLLAGLSAGLALAGCSGGGPTTSSSSSCTSSSGTTTTCTTASDLAVTLSKTSMTDSGSDSVTVTVTAVDVNRNAVSGATVTIVPDNNAIISTSGTTTATDGTLTGTLTVGSDKSDRTIDIVVKSGSITKTESVAVTGATLQATAGAATPGSSATVQYSLTDINSIAIPTAPISITFGGTTTAAVTDVNGKYTFTYTVPSTATVPLTAVAGGVTTTTNVTTSTGTTSPATGTVLSASIAANPSTVSVNSTGSTANQVNVRALFLGASNAPIQYARVRFDLDGDVNGIGGTLTSGTGYVYTDGNGVAQTTYVPSTRGSGNQQLTLRACWSETDFADGACPNAATTAITVSQGAVNLSVLKSGLISEDDTKNAYEMSLVVQVVNSVGQPIAGAQVTPSVDIPRFYRGYYTLGTTWAKFAVNSCDNEDINRNSVLDVYSNGETEDANGSGSLEPRSADISIRPTSTGSDTTDSFGLAYFTLQYGQNLASWEDYIATFTTSVAGTEGSYSTPSANLPVLATALTATTVQPAFYVSPYNFAPSGTAPVQVGLTTVTDPTTGKSGNLCQAQP